MCEIGCEQHIQQPRKNSACAIPNCLTGQFFNTAQLNDLSAKINFAGGYYAITKKLSSFADNLALIFSFNCLVYGHLFAY
jgi:hypothetical protein